MSDFERWLQTTFVRVPPLGNEHPIVRDKLLVKRICSPMHLTEDQAKLLAQHVQNLFCVCEGTKEGEDGRPCEYCTALPF